MTVIRGVTATLMIALLAVGTPVGLVVSGADPLALLPHQWPDLADVQGLWQTIRFGYYDGSLIRDLVLGIVWVAWLSLVWMIITETTRQIRHGIHLPTRITLADPRSWIVGLVATTLILLSTAEAGATSVSAPSDVPTQYDDPQPSEPHRAPSRTWIDPTVHPDCPRITVVHGQTLWGLAEIHLGDPTRYHEIEHLNADRIPRSDHLVPGDVLLLPADARDLPASTNSDHDRSIVVRPGDTASSIAARDLGDSDKWHDLWERNRYQPQPDGRAWLHPDRLLPGWVLWITASPTSPAEQPPEIPQQPSPSSSTTSPPPPPEPGATQSPADDRPQNNSDDQSTPTPLTEVFVSVAVAGTIAAALVSAKMWRRRHYRIGSGDRADLKRPAAPVIRTLRDGGTSEPNDDPEVIDLASTRPKFHITAGDLEPDPPPVSTRIGVRNGRELALVLASARGLGLSGPGAAPAARALLVHLLAQPRPGGLQVLISAPDLSTVFDDVNATTLSFPSAVRVVPSLDAALDQLEEAVLTRSRQTLDATTTPAPCAMLVLLARPTPQCEHRLLAILDSGSGLGVASVLLGQWHPGGTLLVRRDGTVSATSSSLSALSGTHLFHLPSADTRDLLAVLRDAEGPPEPPIPPQTVPEPPSVQRPRTQPRSADTAQSAPVPPLLIRVLGRIQLTLRTDVTQGNLDGVLTLKQQEVLAYLAVHPEGARRDAINDAIWPNSRPPRPTNSFHNTMSLLRAALNDATRGAVNNPIINLDSRYQLDPEMVTTDLWELRHHLQSLRSSAPDVLEQVGHALDLYRGDLAEDLTADWIEPYRESLRRDVLDTLAVVIRAHSDQPQYVLAIQEHARNLDPYNENLYRDIIHTQARLGLRDAIPRTLALLTTALNELDQRPSDDTIQLAEELSRRPAAAKGSTS